MTVVGLAWDTCPSSHLSSTGAFLLLLLSAALPFSNGMWDGAQLHVGA